MGIETNLFEVAEEQGGGGEGQNDADGADGEEEFAPFAVNEKDAADGHHEIEKGEDDVAPVGLHVGKAALQEDVGVVANDGIDAGGSVAEENDAGQQERDDVLAVQERFLDLSSGDTLILFGDESFVHFVEFEIGFSGGARAEKGSAGGIGMAAAE